MTRIYVATSWKNERFDEVVRLLRTDGHHVYSFRNPPHGGDGYKWTDSTNKERPWTAKYIQWVLETDPKAAQGYLSDYRGMNWADVGLLILPCGRSAHLELGYMAGRGKRTIILLEDGEPDLMWLMADHLCLDLSEVRATLRGL